ncbi:MAG: nitrilase-related carbon-nitrogen hydrolase [bacterium]
MRVGVYQFCPQYLNVEANIKHILSRMSRVKADLIVLPELCLTGYLFSTRDQLHRYAEPVPNGPSCNKIINFCLQHNTNLVLGFAEAAGSKIFNSALLITAGGSVHAYRKVHLFTDEKDLFDPGDLPFPVFSIGGVRIGMLVCFDYFFPESARTLALRGAQIVCHPSNLILNYAQSMTITRAQENRIFWLLANRIGFEELGEKKLRFTGQSQIVAPDGTLLYRADFEKEALKIIEINPEQALNKNVTPRNDIVTDRRPEMYL